MNWIQFISVIIPTYNRAVYLKRAIDSVLNQTFKNIELIVVDDGSTDNTPDVVRMYEDKVKYIRIEHSGVSASRNTGIKAASSKWIAFLDSDDYWLNKKLEIQTEYMEKNPHLLISQTDEIWIRNGVRVNPMLKHRKYGGWIFKESLPLCIISPSAVLIHRSIFEDVGYFDETLPICEDYDLWLRVTLKYPVGLIKEKLIVKTGGHDDQLSKKLWGMDRYRVLALEKTLNMVSDVERRRLVLEELVKKLSVLSNGRMKRKHLPNTYKIKLEFYKNEIRKLG
ncbi:MAG: glycosyltransferase [Candidatus Marinimicrobia bacterium]|nr:glycosyltransferase [Candidatus Neomarinimicrobiota bacterium]